MRKVLIVAGDPSGDLIAAQLVESMKRIDPSLSVAGIGGTHLKRVSDRFLENIVDQGAHGFAISFRKLKFFKNLLNETIHDELKNNPPDAVIPVDFYGFNCRVARLAKKMNCRVFYYVSPQFWASRPWRADGLRKIVDLFLCLFPFEIDFYKKKKLPAKFVGHPLLDRIPDASEVSEKQAKVESVIGLLPGSRVSEIKQHLPIMLETCRQLADEIPGIRLLLFTVPHVDRNLYHKIISQFKKAKFMIDLVQDEDYSWRMQVDIAVTASGMETLENTLLGIPMVIMYKTSWFNYWIARMLINIKYLGMPNLLAGKTVVPEYIQWEAKPNYLLPTLLRWLRNPNEQKTIRKELLELRKQFGGGGASDRAARAILEKVA